MFLNAYICLIGHVSLNIYEIHTHTHIKLMEVLLRSIRSLCGHIQTFEIVESG